MCSHYRNSMVSKVPLYMGFGLGLKSIVKGGNNGQPGATNTNNHFTSFEITKNDH